MTHSTVNDAALQVGCDLIAAAERSTAFCRLVLLSRKAIAHSRDGDQVFQPMVITDSR